LTFRNVKIQRKANLRDKILEFADRYRYFHIKDLRHFLDQQKVKFSEKNLKNYLYSLRKEKYLSSAGRAWYSKLKRHLNIEKTPVKKIVKIIKENFPQLQFSCWSNEQLRNFYHHIPFLFINFVYVSTEFMEYVKEVLEENDYTVYLNPKKQDAEKLSFKSKRIIIIRPYVRIRQKVGHYASIEKILVDLHIESKKLNLMDEKEYERIVVNIMENYLLNIAIMLDYADERNVKSEIFTKLGRNKIVPMRNFE